MTTLLFEHEAFGEHETPRGHPERAERYHAASAALKAEEFDALNRRSAPPATRDALLLAHRETYLDMMIEISPKEGFLRLDPDTVISPATLEAAMRGAGGAVAAVDAVCAREARNAFVLSRPPGHHAPPARAMGFCLFNSAAIAAYHARAAHGLNRVAVVDFDVHHGNGTEEIFWHDENAFYASSHEWPQYPGTGRASDRGAFENIANAPLATGSSGDDFRRAWGEKLLPALDAFAPELIVISAGFDAHRADPVGGLQLVEADFDWVTREIMAIANARASGRLVSILEGGYNIAALANSVAGHVGCLMSA